MAMIAEGQIAYHVLMLIGSAGPVAIYFLSLGLVNCQARPCLVSARSDFIALSIVLAPLMLWSIPVAVQFGSGWMLGLAALILAAVFRKLVPSRHEGFVIYNISRRSGVTLIDAALHDDARPFRRIGDTEWESLDGRIQLRATSFVFLRSVTVQLEGDVARIPAIAQRFRTHLEARLSQVEQLPSAVGTGLVLAGVGIAVVPMWLVTRHIQDLVDAVTFLFG